MYPPFAEHEEKITLFHAVTMNWNIQGSKQMQKCNKSIIKVVCSSKSHTLAFRLLFTQDIDTCPQFPLYIFKGW